jgi:tRNA (cmo5U34)-methyltransferase
LDLKTSHWKFDKEVTDVFDNHVRQSVPLYEEIHSLVADISCWYIRDNTNVYDIGTSTGEAIANISKLHEGRNIQYIGIDTSSSMIQKARERFKDQANVSIVLDDITGTHLDVCNASYITSILMIQFIDPSKRQDVVDKIYKGLNLGGAFLLVEKVIGSTTRFDQMYIELYHEMKLKNGLTIDHVLNKARSLRGVQSPNTIEENISMLNNAGFKEVDIFFKWNNFTGLIATK